MLRKSAAFCERGGVPPLAVGGGFVTIYVIYFMCGAEHPLRAAVNGARFSAPLCNSVLRGGAASAPLCKGSWHAVGVTEGLYPRPMIAFTPFSWLPLFTRGAVTPKGYKGATERIFVRITVVLRSAYFLPHNIPLRFRHIGDTYPFSFVTKRKAVRR